MRDDLIVRVAGAIARMVGIDCGGGYAMECTAGGMVANGRFRHSSVFNCANLTVGK